MRRDLRYDSAGAAVEHEHLTRREIEAWRNQGAGDRARITSQIAGCATCRQLAAEVEHAQAPATGPVRFNAAEFTAAGYRARESAGPQRAVWWRRRWALAAATAILVLVVAPFVSQRPDTPDSDVLRGGAITLLAPAGEVSTVEEFRWNTGFAADSFLVEVLDERDAVLSSASTRETRLSAGAILRATLNPGTYRWRVTARDAAGGTILTSPAQAFSLAPSPATP